MASILILAESGFGKTTSILPNEKLGIKGLNPKETFVITTTAKLLPYYKITSSDKLKEGNRVVTDDGKVIAQVLRNLKASPFVNIVLDDIGFVMQNYYMEKALQGGWDTPKMIGFIMGQLFDAIEEVSLAGKNIILLAHPETYKTDNLGGISYRMKATGNMVHEYLTPEGKVDIMLFGKSKFNESTKKLEKVFVTDHDGTYPAKSHGIFDDLYIPNDMGYVIQKLEEWKKTMGYD